MTAAAVIKHNSADRILWLLTSLPIQVDALMVRNTVVAGAAGIARTRRLELSAPLSWAQHLDAHARIIQFLVTASKHNIVSEHYLGRQAQLTANEES